MKYWSDTHLPYIYPPLSSTLTTSTTLISQCELTTFKIYLPLHPILIHFSLSPNRQSLHQFPPLTSAMTVSTLMNSFITFLAPSMWLTTPTQSKFINPYSLSDINSQEKIILHKTSAPLCPKLNNGSRQWLMCD